MSAFKKFIQDLVDVHNNPDKEIYTPNNYVFVHNADGSISVMDNTRHKIKCCRFYGSKHDTELVISHNEEGSWVHSGVSIIFRSGCINICTNQEQHVIQNECDYFSLQLLTHELTLSYSDLTFVHQHAKALENGFHMFYGIGEEITYGYE